MVHFLRRLVKKSFCRFCSKLLLQMKLSTVNLTTLATFIALLLYYVRAAGGASGPVGTRLENRRTSRTCLPSKLGRVRCQLYQSMGRAYLLWMGLSRSRQLDVSQETVVFPLLPQFVGCHDFSGFLSECKLCKPILEVSFYMNRPYNQL